MASADCAAVDGRRNLGIIMLYGCTLHCNDVPQRGTALCSGTHDREDGPPSSGRGAGGLEHVHGILPVGPVAGVCVCPPFDAMAYSPAPGTSAPGCSSDSASAAADQGRHQRAGITVRLGQPGTMADRFSIGIGRPAPLRHIRDRAASSEMVFGGGPSTGGRSLFPVFGEQCRQYAGTVELSPSDGTSPSVDAAKQTLGGGYGLLAACIAGCSLALWRSKPREGEAVAGSEGNSRCGQISRERACGSLNGETGRKRPDSDSPVARRWWWVLLAFIPSSLMLGVTTYLTTDVAPFPLLWVVPLAIYLLTFTLVFARRPVLPPPWLGRVLGLCSVVLLVAFIAGATHPAWLMTSLNLLMFGSAAMICHGELAKGRPAAGRLTEFYLCISLGGVLGGMFNALVAPLLFRNLLEYPLVMVLACAVRPVDIGTGRKASRLADAAWTTVIGISTAASIIAMQKTGLNLGRLSTLCTFGAPALLTYRHVKKPVRFSLGLMAILVAGVIFSGVLGRTLSMERNFFGTLRVTVDAEGKYHQLVQGDTLHGRQSLDPERRNEPLSYYYRTGPIGQVIKAFESSSAPPAVAVVGLGTGSLAAYARPSQDWTFYEIDPAVERIARNEHYFTFLKNCCAKTLRVITGDARLRLKEADARGYGLIVLDAFSSDSIPTHLVTREALRLYLAKLADDGVLAFHITNRRLDLEPVLANLAYDAGLAGLIRNDADLSMSDMMNGKERSVWVVMSRHKDGLTALIADPRWHTLRPSRCVGVWTDDFSNILGVLSWKI
jgi:hypothetical protein